MFNGKDYYEQFIGKKIDGTRLTVLGIAESDDDSNKKVKFLTKCECGKEKAILADRVIKAETKSCGCLIAEKSAERMRKYKNSTKDNKGLFSLLNGMKRRCYSKKEPRYKDYGGRGIYICNEWMDTNTGFDNFVEWAKENGYEKGLTIERIDNNGPYAPWNCKWSTRKEQNQNKRTTKWVDYNGEHIQLKVLCERLGLCYDTVHNRIYDIGWDVKKAIETPSIQENSLMSKCKELGLNYGTVRDRIKKLGWSEEEALNTPFLGRKNSYKSYAEKSGERCCERCGKSFLPVNGGQKYCSAKCREQTKRERRKNISKNT